MKILYYNWIQFDNKGKIGGGVNVYQYNLIEEIIKNKKNEVFFLSSGWNYSPFGLLPYIRKTKNVFGNNCQSFEIINSPIMAPAFWMSRNVEKYIYDKKTYDVFKKFLEKHGPFDVIHFNNFEGISLNVLKIKKLYPNTKIIYSVHNYQLICPTVQYFNDKKRKICDNFSSGKECLDCSCRNFNCKEYLNRTKNYFKNYIPVSIYKNMQFFIELLLKLNNFLFRKYYLVSDRNRKASIYKYYRENNISLINENVDSVLSVSECVTKIMKKHGVNEKKIHTVYIGTKFAEKEKKYSIADKTSTFTITYLGFERIDKGYFFLLEALSKLELEISKQININFAVVNHNPVYLKSLLNKFNSVKIYNGYEHKDLPQILANTHLGIVPVLWEDNLPQVAIEMVACGVPILCSSFGGASELCQSPLFVFKGGDIDDFINKLTLLVNNRNLLDEYWPHHPPLKTMNEHIYELEKFYGESANA